MKHSDIRKASFTGPTRFAMHTIPGYGKTTLASEFPGVIFEAAEEGFPRDLPATPDVLPEPRDWKDFYDHVDFLTYEDHPFQTFALDTVDWAEPFLHRYLCERDSGRKTEMNKAGNKLISIEDYGYGRGYTAAAEEFRRYLDALLYMQKKRRMHLVFLMHTHVKTFKNPSGPDYDQYVPKVHKDIAAILGEFVENFFFGFYDIAAAKMQGEQKAKGTSSGKRLLGTQATAAYDAKNRIDLKPVVELDDPRELIPYLLGQRVVRREWQDTQPREPERREPERPRDRDREDVRQGELARDDRRDHVLDRTVGDMTGGPTRERAADERIARNFAEDAKRDFESPRQPDVRDSDRHDDPRDRAADGKSALHTDRQADEQRRRDEAFEEQRKRNEEAKAREQREYDEKQERQRKEREAQGWKEPKPPSEAKTTPPPAKGSKADELIAKITDLLVRAEQAFGTPYRTKVEKWTKGAKGDVDKLEAIIEDVEKQLKKDAAPAA